MPLGLVITLLAALVRALFPTSGVTLAALRRAQGAKRTALLDEMQQIAPKNKIWNRIDAGFTRSPLAADAIVDKSIEAMVRGAKDGIDRSRLHGAIFVCGYGDYALAPTKSRGIMFPLKRKLKTEPVEKSDAAEHGDMLRELASKVQRWVWDNRFEIKNARPNLKMYDNRAADVIEPLLQIASVIGSECEKAARETYELLGASGVLNEEEILLPDIADIICDPGIRVGDPPMPFGGFVHTADLLEQLREQYPYRWGELGNKKLWKILKSFGIEPGRLRPSSWCKFGWS